MYTTFDPRIEIGTTNVFKGEFTNLKLRQDPPDPGHVTNKVIDPGRDFYIDMAWKVTGSEVPLRMNAVAEDPDHIKRWQIYAYAESVGPGPEKQLGSIEKLPIGTIAADEMTWTHAFKVPANSLPEHAGATASGVYLICVVVFANSNLPGRGSDVIGFGEIPLILTERPQ